jgi:hypothetical protein
MPRAEGIIIDNDNAAAFDTNELTTMPRVICDAGTDAIHVHEMSDRLPPIKRRRKK